MTDVIFALLKNDRAIDVFREAGKDALSENPIVRAIIDHKIGTVCLARARPDDTIEERIIRVETPDADRARQTLGRLAGVSKVASSVSDLTR